MSFTRDLDLFIDRTDRRSQRIVHELNAQLLTSLVMKSPVDTGQFRANWNVSAGSADTSISENTDKEGMSTISRGIAAIESIPAGTTTVISNNMPYAVPLENGHSQQGAPNGMLRITVQSFQAILESVARGQP